MVKVLLLQQWYQPLGPGSWKRRWATGSPSAALWGWACRTPRRTIRPSAAFVRRLEVDGLSAPLFTELAAQLAAQGLVLKQGTLLDATLVASQVRRPPLAAGRGAPSTTDPEAAWTQRAGGARSHFGYKVHLGVDADTGLVRRAVLTPANVYESEVADALVSGDERAVYGDRAYESRRRRQWLRAQGINDRIMHRSHKHQQRALPSWQQRNATPSSRRAGRWWRRSSAPSSAAMATSGCATAGWGATPWSCGSAGLMAYNLRKADTLPPWAAG